MNMSKDKLEEQLSNIGSTSFIIAYERAIESSREDALFSDPLSDFLGGARGKAGSDHIKNYAATLGFEGWEEFHIQWTACRTAYIDQWITNAVGDVKQVVNLGAGLDTRPFRLQAMENVDAVFEVDREDLNCIKEYYYSNEIAGARPFCTRKNVTCDLSVSGMLSMELEHSEFNQSQSSIWLLEGLLMYLSSEAQKNLIEEFSCLAAAGSKALVNVTHIEDEKVGYTIDEYVRMLSSMGWHVDIVKFGDPDLNFGRFPERFEPNSKFTLLICSK
eukprot:TRINITY_DN11187_c0_g1_i1.p1 TRINITY_DN11187_c0_g1~~TRINITY_DN11187_c0_g1_i1.p1  ORF type:complete len:311 (+),score=56.21 TRINITY_DN11187_c0_g1_i1:113-934(+)